MDPATLSQPSPRSVKRRAKGSMGLSPVASRTPAPKTYAPTPEMDPTQKEEMLADVTVDHADRLTAFAGALLIIRDRVLALDARLAAVEPKAEATEIQLVKAAQDILENDQRLKAIINANDERTKAKLEENDADIKAKMEALNTHIKEVAASVSGADTSRGGRPDVGAEGIDREARKKI